MRVGARKGCKEHLERSESASSRTYNNNIYNINIYNTYTHSSMYGGFATPEAFRSLRSLHPLDSRKTIAKRKGKVFYLPLLFYTRPATPCIQYRILYIHTREAAHSSKLCVILIIPKIKNAIPLRAYASKPVITHPQEKNMQRITQRTPNAN